jgi:branched-chain amino acid transport system substrate-binding protein
VRSWITSLLLVALVACSPTAPATSQPPSNSTPAAGGAAAQPTSAPANGSTYAFGVLVPLTGPAASIGTDFRQGLDMAVDEINASGGAAGMRLEPNVQDHKGTAQGGVEAMNQLVNIARVPFVISTFSSVTLAAQPIAAQNSVVLVNVGGTDSTLLEKPWLYDNQVMAPHLMPPLAQLAWDEGKRNAALLTSNDAYGDGSRKAFRDAWEKLGGKIVGDELFAIGATDFSAQLTKLKAANPDLVMAVAVGEPQGLILKQARALGLQADFMGPLATDDLIRVGGPAAEGFIDSGIAVDPNTQDAQAKRFLEGFKQRYGKDAYWGNGTMYEAVYLLRDLVTEVVKEGGDPQSGQALLKALQGHPEFHNFLAGGTVRFTDDHSVDRTLANRKVVNGQFQVFKIAASS